MDLTTNYLRSVDTIENIDIAILVNNIIIIVILPVIITSIITIIIIIIMTDHVPHFGLFPAVPECF